MEWPWSRKDPELAAAAAQTSTLNDGVDHLVAALPDPILILDSSGIVIKANANAEEMLEMKPSRSDTESNPTAARSSGFGQPSACGSTW
jgi:PAS domain-containing protein